MPVKKEGHLCLNEALCTGWDKHKRRGCPPATLVSTHSLPEAHLVATGPACFLISFRHLPDQLRYCPPSYYSKVWVMPDSCCPGLEELCLRGDRAGNALSAQMLLCWWFCSRSHQKREASFAKSSCLLLPASWLLFSPCRLWATALPLNSIPRPNFSLQVILL